MWLHYYFHCWQFHKRKQLLGTAMRQPRWNFREQQLEAPHVIQHLSFSKNIMHQNYAKLTFIRFYDMNFISVVQLYLILTHLFYYTTSYGVFILYNQLENNKINCYTNIKLKVNKSPSKYSLIIFYSVSEYGIQQLPDKHRILFLSRFIWCKHLKMKCMYSISCTIPNIKYFKRFFFNVTFAIKLNKNNK